MCREEAAKYAFTPPVKKQTKKKVIEIWQDHRGGIIRSCTDGSSRDMVPGSLCKVETLVGGIPPGTFSFQDPHRVIIEDAGMDFLNHPRFKCAQNEVQVRLHFQGGALHFVSLFT